HRHLCALVATLLHRDDLRPTDNAEAILEATLIGGRLPHALPATYPSRSVPSSSAVFASSGVAVLRHGAAHLTIACMPNGQHGRGGHNHNDKGSFELTLAGRDVIVDGGCFVYTADPATRNAFRSTAAHNTL